MFDSRRLFVLSVLALTSACSATTGKLGESCTKRSDCGSGLYCINQICVEGAPSVAGLGSRGETCTAAADCQNGLVCVPVTTGSSNVTIGRCDLENYNLKPTGNVCGAECKQDIDCCELPVESQFAGARSCSDLVQSLNGVACDTTADATNQHFCFLYATYCNCKGTASSINPWVCNTTLGRCQYKASCQNNGEVPKGCPAFSRAGHDLTITCTNSSCGAGAGTPICTQDLECLNKTIQDLSDTCTANECVCLTSSSLTGFPGAAAGCYRKCKVDLDCAQGYVCGDAAHPNVCIKVGDCTVGAAGDLFCAVKKEEVTAKCVNSTCQVPCSKDLDCSFSGLSNSYPFDGEVCSQGFCTPLGCASDAECSAGSGVKTFCTAKSTGTTGGVASAITSSP